MRSKMIKVTIPETTFEVPVAEVIDSIMVEEVLQSRVTDLLDRGELAGLDSKVDNALTDLIDELVKRVREQLHKEANGV